MVFFFDSLMHHTKIRHTFCIDTNDMKQKLYILLAIGAMLMSCKEHKWMDWKTQNDIWLEQHAATYKDSVGFYIASDGLQYRIMADSLQSGARPNATSTVVCDYSGFLINGYQFDGGTAQFSMSSVVAGFAEGLQKIHQHGDIEIYVPYYLGYDQSAYANDSIGKAVGMGTEGTSSYIPPYSVLIFKVHLTSVSN